MKLYYYTIDGVEAEDPCSEADLAAYFFQGTITANTPIRIAGTEQWQTYSSLPLTPATPVKRAKFSVLALIIACIVICFGAYMIWVSGYDKRAISDRIATSLLNDATCPEDIFKRDFNAVELREAYHNQKEYILSRTSPTLSPEVAKALKTLDEYYAAARAELGLPPIN